MDFFTRYLNAIEAAMVAMLRLLGVFVGDSWVRPLYGVLQLEKAPSYAETLRKIEVAKGHLSEAAAAVDTIKAEFNAERDALDSLILDLRAKRDEIQRLQDELIETRNLLTHDKEKLRAALGLDARWGRITGFVAGVVASLLATLLWEYAPRAWNYATQLL